MTRFDVFWVIAFLFCGFAAQAQQAKEKSDDDIIRMYLEDKARNSTQQLSVVRIKQQEELERAKKQGEAWYLRPANTLKENIEVWAARSNYTLIWTAQDFRVQSELAYHGSFEQVVEAFFQDAHKNQLRIKATLFRGRGSGTLKVDDE